MLLYKPRYRAAETQKSLVHAERVALQLLGSTKPYHSYVLSVADEVTRDHEPITPVISGAADDERPVSAISKVLQNLRARAATGILHQDQPRYPRLLDQASIERLNLRT